jgi:hypothetical protein
MVIEKCFYVPGTATIIDLVDDNGRSVVRNETLEEIRLRYPGAEIGLFDAVFAHVENSFKSESQEITKEQYWYALEVLPPVAWRINSGEESFKMSEQAYGNITAIYARIGDRYFTLSDSISTPHKEIIRRCKSSMRESNEKKGNPIRGD